LRARNERCNPGGGGINVARVFVRLGGNARCYYLSGGATGVALDGLLDLHQLVRTRIPIEGATRVATTVLERASGKEYRFVPAGPTIAPGEWMACLDLISRANCDFLVASGSLPEGVPDDFYARVAHVAAARGIRVVLDSSGRGLATGLAGGGYYLVKPNLEELGTLAGRSLTDEAGIAEVASGIVERGEAELVAVTMGLDGAMFVSRSERLRLPAVRIAARSTVGAGDSFVAAMVHGLALGWKPADAFRLGMASGAAAVLSPGTGLAQADDIYRLHEQFAPEDRHIT
jgi:6-phosphofructokinase 2